MAGTAGIVETLLVEGLRVLRVAGIVETLLVEGLRILRVVGKTGRSSPSLVQAVLWCL